MRRGNNVVNGKVLVGGGGTIGALLSLLILVTVTGCQFSKPTIGVSAAGLAGGTSSSGSASMAVYWEALGGVKQSLKREGLRVADGTYEVLEPIYLPAVPPLKIDIALQAPITLDPVVNQRPEDVIRVSLRNSTYVLSLPIDSARRETYPNNAQVALTLGSVQNLVAIANSSENVIDVDARGMKVSVTLVTPPSGITVRALSSEELRTNGIAVNDVAYVEYQGKKAHLGKAFEVRNNEKRSVVVSIPSYLRGEIWTRIVRDYQVQPAGCGDLTAQPRTDVDNAHEVFSSDPMRVLELYDLSLATLNRKDETVRVSLEPGESKLIGVFVETAPALFQQQIGYSWNGPQYSLLSSCWWDNNCDCHNECTRCQNFRKQSVLDRLLNFVLPEANAMLICTGCTRTAYQAHTSVIRREPARTTLRDTTIRVQYQPSDSNEVTPERILDAALPTEWQQWDFQAQKPL
jgi:hypothetical protein